VGVLDDFAERFAAPPPDSTIQRASSLHQNVRALIPDDTCSTFLQGSYRNGTALADINDVDVVVLFRGIERSWWWPNYDWEQLFAWLHSHISKDPRYAGKVSIRDKCLTIDTGVNVDIVPAIHDGDPDRDPIWICSRSASAERRNWPREHFSTCTGKNARTDGMFKRSVRLMKRWARCHFGGTKVAPSYYIESLLHSLPDEAFCPSLAVSFCTVADAVRSAHGFSGWTSVDRAGGEGDLLAADEWGNDEFLAFRKRLYESREHAAVALSESDVQRAKAAWRRAFNGFDY
jgi:hypothetical protein